MFTYDAEPEFAKLGVGLAEHKFLNFSYNLGGGNFDERKTHAKILKHYWRKRLKMQALAGVEECLKVGQL